MQVPSIQDDQANLHHLSHSSLVTKTALTRISEATTHLSAR